MPFLFAVALAAGATQQAALPETGLARGARLYGGMCAVCHGSAGEGYKADNAPALSEAGFLGSATDAFLRRAIADGRAGTTMSAWAAARGGPLAEPEIDEVVAYIRSWEKGPRVPLDERPTHGSPARGGELFAARCASCHGAAGVGGKAAGIGDPGFLEDASDGFLRLAIRDGRPNGAMPAFGESLGEQGVDDLLAWLRQLQSTAPAKGGSATLVPDPLKSILPLNPDGREPAGFKAFPAMTPADVVKRELDGGARLAFLDARPTSDYLVEHIAGAVSMPFYDPNPPFSALPKDTWLVCYCGCPHAESGRLAESLLKAGFKKVAVLDEGLRYWKDKGYGLRQGREP